jgi:hypothetical protein
VTTATVPAAAAPRAWSRAAVLVFTGLVGSITLTTVAARYAHPSEVSPVVPRGDWNRVWVWSLVVAFALYGAGTLLAYRGHIRLSAAVAVAVAVQVLPLAAPLLLSKDVYLYWGEGRVVAVHHANPYVRTPADDPKDPAFPWVSESWRDQPAPYGPAWEVIGAAPAALAGDSHRAAAFLYRALAVAAMLASLAIVAVRTRRASAVAFLGWSPLLAVHYAGGGHSDALMMALVLGALALGTTARGGALWAAASAFKPFPPVLIPLELARRRFDVGRRFWIGLLGTGAAIALLATAVFGTHWVSAATVGAHQTSALGGVHWLGRLGLPHREAVLAGAAVFVLVYAALLWRAWRTGRGHLSLAASALCLTSSLLRPWYALWPVALAAIEEDAVGAVVAYVLTGYLLFGDAVRL